MAIIVVITAMRIGMDQGSCFRLLRGVGDWPESRFAIAVRLLTLTQVGRI